MALITDYAETIAAWAVEVVEPILGPTDVGIVYGEVVIDECCPTALIVRVGQVLPLIGPTPGDCGQPWTVAIDVMVVGCVPTLDDRGRGLDAWPNMVPVVDAGQALWLQAQCDQIDPDWQAAPQAMVPVGAEGGCVTAALALLCWER